jgi:hypothetical protein
MDGWSKRSRLAALGMIAMLTCGVGPADQPADNTAPLPDPATISVPDVNASSGSRESTDPDVYFYFHKAGVSFAAALADYQACNRLNANVELFAPPPKFVPIGTDTIPDTGDVSAAVWGQFGLVGLIITGISHDEDVRSWQRINLRRCMSYKGYQRYVTSKKVWTAINSGPAGDVVTRLALIASGPRPQREAVEP